jgi:glycosyltransferase involved in cell wall biosynthesis
VDVSVVIPTRNRSALLGIALRSAVMQRDVDLEVVVVDEASSDDTLAVIASFGDPRIRVIRHERPQGVSAARNRGTAESRADWIAFLDDDDLWAPHKLAAQLKAARDTGASWVYVGHVNINMAYQVTGGAPPLPPDRLMEQIPRRNVVPGGCSGVIATKRALDSAGLFDLRLQTLADWDLWIRLARGGVPACVPQPLVAYRLHGGQMSLNASQAEAEFRIVAERNAEADLGLLLRYLGWWALRVKNHRDAFRLFMRAWAQGQPGSTRLAVADLAMLGRHLLERRFGIRVPHSSVDPQHESWRADGQAWIDTLVGGRAD